ncbi:MAG: hypothetical protein ABIC91_01880 [Nanoarchaeota archaeon]|nr:hypothetical protein [Nanoarchaeota archaeon]MBU1030495.1 hypothetical protein [Nanoarchaeota archaeon]MBU1850608.1 hypothetical protein [Nanoarchaeota archaeon]
MLNLIVEPRIVKTWTQFKKENPKHSIALDGYVKGRTRRDINGPWMNFNHHEDVDRSTTNSTCAQIALAIKQRMLEDHFFKDGEFKGQIYINDPDQDTALSVWLLQNPERIAGEHSEPLINRLIFAEDFLDRTAGAYPFSLNSPIMCDLAWIFEPYNIARKNKDFYKISGEEMKTVVEAVSSRIDKYSLGQGGKLQPDARYETLYSNSKWVMVKEIGPQYRTDLMLKGIRAYVSVKERENEVFNYVMGKMTPYVNFPVEKFSPYFNECENIKPEETDRWGGGNFVIGSPRERGSKIKPEEIIKHLNKLLKKY